MCGASARPSLRSERYQTVDELTPEPLPAPTAGFIPPGIIRQSSRKRDSEGGVDPTCRAGTFNRAGSRIENIGWRASAIAEPASAEQIREAKRAGHGLIGVGSTSTEGARMIALKSEICRRGRGHSAAL